MKRVIDVSDTLYKTCKRLVSEGDPRPSESCIANSEPYDPQDEWIPVSEKLPEEKEVCLSDSGFGFDFGEVLCTTIWGDVRAYKFGKPIGHDKPHFWLGGGIMDEYVIAWQYEPEPYKK